MADILIYVDKNVGDDSNDGTERHPLATADEAFRRLPSSWDGSAEIVFIDNKDSVYPISTAAVAFGTPIGPGASPLVIRGAYKTVAMHDGARVLESGNQVEVNFPDWHPGPDELIGAVLTRSVAPLDSASTLTPRIPNASSIRGNTQTTIYLQRRIDPEPENAYIHIDRPAVTLQPQVTLTLTSHDAGRSPNLTMIGIKIEPVRGAGLNLINVRVQCDSCEFFLGRNPRSLPTDPISQIFVHSDSRINGGIEMPNLSPGLPFRAQAGVFIHSDDHHNMIWAARGGILSGHLTFDQITVRVSQGGVFTPTSLEAREAPIQILSGGSAIAQPSWGTESNKARIRNVPANAGFLPPSPGVPRTGGIGLRVYNGSIASPLAPIHLDIYGCEGDGIRLDTCSIASFGPPGGDAGLVTSGEPNRGFGMNIRNASRALVGRDANRQGLRGNNGREGTEAHVVLDDGEAFTWGTLLAERERQRSTPGMSLVRVNS
jgi:hypothetical protein